MGDSLLSVRLMPAPRLCATWSTTTESLKDADSRDQKCLGKYVSSHNSKNKLEREPEFAWETSRRSQSIPCLRSLLGEEVIMLLQLLVSVCQAQRRRRPLLLEVHFAHARSSCCKIARVCNAVDSEPCQPDVILVYVTSSGGSFCRSCR